MSPLSASSMGELRRSPLSVSTLGELTITIIPIGEGVQRGGSSRTAKEQQYYLAQIKHEDEVILAIIMASVDLIE